MNKFNAGDGIEIVSSDTSSNLTDNTTTRNSDSSKKVDSEITSIIDRKTNDPNAGSVNVDIKSGVITNEQNKDDTKPQDTKDNNNTKDDKILGMNKTLFYVIVSILLILGIGGGYMYYKNKKTSSTSSTSSVPSSLNSTSSFTPQIE